MINNYKFNIDQIESIEFLDERETIDISVEDTEMFFANDIYTHNSSINQAVVELTQMGGNIKRAQKGHLVISIGKSAEQKKEGNKANIAILKARFFKDGSVYEDSLFDNATMKIELNTNPVRKKEKNNENKNESVSNSFEDSIKLANELLGEC